VAPLAFPADPGLARMAEALATVTSEKTFETRSPTPSYGARRREGEYRAFGAAEPSTSCGSAPRRRLGSNVYARTG
jgi:hypothetical protein